MQGHPHLSLPIRFGCAGKMVISIYYVQVIISTSALRAMSNVQDRVVNGLRSLTGSSTCQYIKHMSKL